LENIGNSGMVPGRDITRDVIVWDQRRTNEMNNNSNWQTFAKFQPNFDSKWRKLEMRISLEPEFSWGQGQNFCNFKYFLVVIVPFLCASIFFILLKRVTIIDLLMNRNFAYIIRNGYCLMQGRPTCGPKIFLCGPNWIQNLNKNRCFDRFPLGFW
jgi:hypothetical protein